MPRLYFAIAPLILLLGSSLVYAQGEHRWVLTELFSDPTGKYQYVELTNTGYDDSQQLDHGFIKSLSQPLGPLNYRYVLGELPNNMTKGRSALIATQAVSELLTSKLGSGFAADFSTLDEGFFSTTSDTLEYQTGSPALVSYNSPGPAAKQSFDNLSTLLPTLPLDGVNSIHFSYTGENDVDHDFVIGPASPRMFSMLTSDPEVSFAVAVPEPSGLALSVAAIVAMLLWLARRVWSKTCDLSAARSG